MVRQAIREEGAMVEAFELIEEIYEIYYLKKIEIEFESCNDSYRLIKQLRAELKEMNK